MSHATPDPFRLPVWILALTGSACLAGLTLRDNGATMMFVAPWTWVFVAGLATPPAALLLRLARPGPAVRLPAPAWLAAITLTGLWPLVSAALSPYRGPSLLVAAVPFSALCLFLLLQDWLNGPDNRHRIFLERVLAGAAALVAITSTVQWLGGNLALSREEFFSRTLFYTRNPHPLGHSNYTAGLMLLVLPWTAQQAWRSCGWRRALMVFAGGLALLNLFTSGSRGGLLGLAALAVAGAAVSQLGWKRIGLLAGGGVLFVCLLAVANPRIRDFLGPVDPSAAPNLSTVQRQAMLQAGWTMGSERPLLGWGPGITPLVYPRFRAQLDGGAENVLQLHNTPVHLWAETGAVGLLGPVLLLGLGLGHWRRSPTAAASLAGYAVFAVTDFQLDVPVFAAATVASVALLAVPTTRPASNAQRLILAGLVLGSAALIAGLGQRDPAPTLNANALTLARDATQHDQAVALLRGSLALNPDQEIAHFNLGWLLVVPEPAAAEKHFLAAARLVPAKGGLYFGLGLARLNQGHPAAAARAFALECVNDPHFLASPWWSVPAIAALRDATAAEFETLLAGLGREPAKAGLNPWRESQVTLLRSLGPRLGRPSPGPELSYRRQRIGYPVLMRNLDVAPPFDLYDVREDPRFPAAVSLPLPEKGWLPSPLLLKLLDASPVTSP